MWGVLRGETILLSAPSTQLRHVVASPVVSVHIDDGSSVVIVEGRASVEADETLIDEFVRLYNAKYRYELPPRAPLQVEATKVLAWTIRGEAARDGFIRGGKWV